MTREDCVFCIEETGTDYGCEALNRRYCDTEAICRFYKSKEEYDLNSQTRYVTRKKRA